MKHILISILSLAAFATSTNTAQAQEQNQDTQEQIMQGIGRVLYIAQTMPNLKLSGLIHVLQNGLQGRKPTRSEYQELIQEYQGVLNMWNIMQQREAQLFQMQAQTGTIYPAQMAELDTVMSNLSFLIGLYSSLIQGCRTMYGY